jgi:hypothetical protein
MSLDEELQFKLELLQLQMEHPLRSTHFKNVRSLDQIELYIKWWQGDDRGKLAKVNLGGQQATVRPSGNVDVDLKALDVLTFTSRISWQLDAVQARSSSALRLTMLLLHVHGGKEESRTQLVSKDFDLSELLHNVRAGEQAEFDFKLKSDCVLRCRCLVDIPGRVINVPRLVPPPSVGRKNEASMLLAPLDCNSGDEITTAHMAIEAARAINPHLRTTPIVPITTMLQSGDRREVLLSAVPFEVANDLIFCEQAPFMAYLHDLRKNRNVAEAPWQSGDAHLWKRSQYDARFGTEYKQCVETSLLVCAGKESPRFFKLSVIEATVADACRPQLLVTTRKTSTGTAVEFVGHTHFSNSILRRGFGSIAANLMKKLLDAAENALRALTEAPSPSAALTLSPTQDRGQLLDPDLWRRLGDDIAINAQVTLHYLAFLWEVRGPLPQDEKSRRCRLRSIDQMLRRFSSDFDIANLCCRHLVFIKEHWGAREMVRLYEPIESAVAQCFELHRASTLSLTYRATLLDELRAQCSAVKNSRIQYIHSLKDPFEAFAHEDIISDAELAEIAAQHAARQTSPLRELSFAEVSNLTRLLGFQLRSAPVIHECVMLLAVLDDRTPLVKHAGFRVMLDCILRLHPELRTKYQKVLSSFDGTYDSEESPFSRLYGAAISEAPLDSFDVNVNGGASTLFVTKSFVCVGSTVIGKEQIVRTSLFRNFLKPGVELEIQTPTGSRHVKFTLWNRSKFIALLRSQ